MTATLTATIAHVDLPYRTDAGIGPTAHIGMIVTSNDQTLPYEARRMLGIPGIALYESRLLSVRPREGELSVHDLARLADPILLSARQINTLRSPDVVAVGCTSGAMVIGHATLERQIREIYPQAAVTDPLTGLLAALAALQARRICFVSPYPRSVSDMMIGRLQQSGYEVPIAGTFHKEAATASADAAFISPESIADAVLRLGRSEAIDAVFVACTQMRAADLLQRLESEIGKPVVTSNQALCWHALRLAGYRDPVGGWGQLFLTELMVMGQGA